MNNYLYRHKDCFCNEAGKVVWITGLSGSGKSTVAQELWMLLKNNGVPSILLDGDELRNVFGEQDNYEIQQRLKISKKYSRLCKLLSEQGFNVVIGTISMFHEVCVDTSSLCSPKSNGRLGSGHLKYSTRIISQKNIVSYKKF